MRWRTEDHALHGGQGVLDSNRICQDGGSFATNAVGGYGSCSPSPSWLSEYTLRGGPLQKAPS